jgi:hypothetical protein
VKKPRGEYDIEAIFQRLNRLTMDERRATAAQTLEVVLGLLVQHRRNIMDGDDSTHPVFPSLSVLNAHTHRCRKE